MCWSFSFWVSHLILGFHPILTIGVPYLPYQPPVSPPWVTNFRLPQSSASAVPAFWCRSKLQFFGIQRREENHPVILLEYVYYINMCLCIYIYVDIYIYIQYIMSTTCIQSCGQFLFLESASYLWMPSPLEQITTLVASIFRWEKIHGDLWRKIIPNVLQIGG